MALNPNIILAGQTPDIMGAMDRGRVAAEGQINLNRQNALAALYQDQGARIMAGDQNALNALARMDPNAALGTQQNILGVQSARQDMDFTAKKMAALDTATQREAEAYAKSLSAEQAAQEAAALEAGIKQALAAPTPEAFDALMVQSGRPEMVGQFDNREVLAAQFMSVAEILKMNAGPEPLSAEGKLAADVKAGILPQGTARTPETVVNVGGSSGPKTEIGSIPQGFAAVVDPTSPAGYRMVPIPGGPEDTSAADASAAGANTVATDTITTAAARAREAASKRNLGGLGASLVANIPYTDSAEVERQIDVLRANAATTTLQAMREASPTGATGLGALTAPEMKVIQDKAGALNQNSPTFLRDLEDYERTLLRVIHGPEAGDRIFAETRSDSAPTTAPETGARRLKFNAGTGELE
jgi:hypothetical protein